MAELGASKAVAASLPAAPIDRRFDDMAPSEVAERFGGAFADAIAKLPPGGWHGPIVSGLGLHLVKVDGRRASRPPRLADVRQRVENDWRAAAVERAEAASYRELAAGYDIVIEPRR